MSAYKIEVSITPCCTSCGDELGSMTTIPDVSRERNPFQKDNPFERKDRRVFVPACQKCFVFVRDIDALKAAVERIEGTS
jgi:hypothetical protein